MLDIYERPTGDLHWLKSTYSNPENCVEIAALPGGAKAMRDGKDPGRGVLCFTAGEWDAFVRGVRAGEFD